MLPLRSGGGASGACQVSFQPKNEGARAKPYKFIGFGAMDATKPCKFIRFGAMDVTKPYKFIGLAGRKSASGPQIGLLGWISAGFELGNSQILLSGRRSAGRRADLEAFPI